MSSEYAICPICGEENLAVLPLVKRGESYKEGSCCHRLWSPIDTYAGLDFLTEFLKNQKNDPAIRLPGFHSLNLNVVPKAALEAKHESLEKILADNIHEVKGWWFGTIEEQESACKDLVNLLKPLCDFYS